MSMRDEIETAVARQLLRLPAAWLRPLGAHKPLVVEGRRLDPKLKAALALIRAANRPKIHTLGARAARKEAARLPAVFEARAPAVGCVERRAITGPDGEIPIRVYQPEVRPRGTLVFFHGGGGVVGDLDVYDGSCRNLCVRAGCSVVSVDYRLAPEHPFPAAVHDAVEAFRWTRENGAEVGCNGPFAVGGDSMGGCLAAVVAQQLRGPEGPAFQLLLYPVTNSISPSESRATFARGFLLERDTMDWFHDCYLGGADPTDPRASPLQAESLEGVAPTHIVTAGFDPLRDEGDAYARALESAGVDVSHVRANDQVHGFLQLTGISHRSASAVTAMAQVLARALAPGGRATSGRSHG